jgi:hypothetical protein
LTILIKSNIEIELNTSWEYYIPGRQLLQRFNVSFSGIAAQAESLD